MFIRTRAMRSPEPASSMEANFASSGADKGDQDSSAGGQPTGDNYQRVFNENKKLQRLLEKQQKELQALTAQVQQFAPMQEQVSRFQNLFGGKAGNEGGEQPKSYLDRVKRAHQALKEHDPNGNGLALTLEGAELLESLRSENEQLKRNMSRMESPQFVAEQSMFVDLEGQIRDTISQFFGESSVEDNYPDFERVAIDRLKKIKSESPADWLKLLRSQEVRKQFVKAVFAAKMPKIESMPGWQKVDTYTKEQAKADLARAEKMSTEARAKQDRNLYDQAVKLQAKARQRLLPELLGLNIHT